VGSPEQSYRIKIIVNIVKEADLSDIFGSLNRKLSGQKFKDFVKQGWE